MGLMGDFTNNFFSSISTATATVIGAATLFRSSQDMASKRQSMDSPSASSDLISNLPADVIMNILLRLPLQEAVRTSLLSKGWRYKWTTIPDLIFDDYNFSPVSKVVNTSHLLFFIYQVLLQHEGPISKFELDVPLLGSCPEMDPLISFLSRKNIEEFTLIWQGNHKIPYCLFSCLKMRSLCLHGCVLKPPPDFAGFAKLTDLELCSVDLPASFAETFVARCPLLECLKLSECTNLDSVGFYAPNLQELWYHGQQISSVCFKNTPSLQILYIEGYNSLKSSRNTWIDAFRSLPSLEYLQLGSRFNLMLDAGDILASHLNSLVMLELHLHIGIARRAALSLIKSSPNLQKLKLHFHGQAEGIQLSEAKETWDGSLEKLQSIEILNFTGSMSEIAVIELLLAKSPMLETMHVSYIRGCWNEVYRSCALEKINQVRRASPRAQVIFLEVKVE